jgi:hypothetical protein
MTTGGWVILLAGELATKASKFDLSAHFAGRAMDDYILSVLLACFAPLVVEPVFGYPNQAWQSGKRTPHPGPADRGPAGAMCRAALRRPQHHL